MRRWWGFCVMVGYNVEALVHPRVEDGSGGCFIGKTALELQKNPQAVSADRLSSPDGIDGYKNVP